MTKLRAALVYGHKHRYLGCSPFIKVSVVDLFYLGDHDFHIHNLLTSARYPFCAMYVFHPMEQASNPTRNWLVVCWSVVLLVHSGCLLLGMFCYNIQGPEMKESIYDFYPPAIYIWSGTMNASQLEGSLSLSSSLNLYVMCPKCVVFFTRVLLYGFDAQPGPIAIAYFVLGASGVPLFNNY